MSRTYVVTGAAAGIGRATAELMKSRGGKVIGVDLAGSDVTADLSTEAGCSAMVEAVSDLSGGTIDAVVAIAGVMGNTPLVARVNYFGAIRTLTGLRPLLARSAAPRAAAVSSMASLHEVDQPLLDALAAEDEEGAIVRAKQIASPGPLDILTYATSKRALALWIRRNSPTADWAGAGIPLNAIAPGVIRTAMTASFFTDVGRHILDDVPMPLNGPADPIVAARLLAWITSEENSHVTGQVIFQDGGSDAIIRGDSVW
ncbi:SDR family oxidoreductase [Arthrobacter sp. NPDC080073]|uniref:SDR family oxidoreductase n=1 Tax=Arthrobacter sp. NPDC080073 TaxID=3155919 RepID=UPI00343AFCA1